MIMTEIKQPRLSFDNIWMGWTYGGLNQSKQTVRERVSALQTPLHTWSFIDQTHSDIVKHAVKSSSLGEADAQFTSQISLGLAIQTADCVPVFLIGRTGSGLVQIGAVHAGWRGLANQIISKTVAQMSNVHSAVIGPCIGVNRYEVGEEVISAIVGAGVPRDICTLEKKPRPHLNVKLTAAHQLRQAGVRNIETMGYCTFSDDGWASYRRDASSAGRIISMIGILKE